MSEDLDRSMSPISNPTARRSQRARSRANLVPDMTFLWQDSGVKERMILDDSG
jgi:hypothetical protein